MSISLLLRKMLGAGMSQELKSRAASQVLRLIAGLMNLYLPASTAQSIVHTIHAYLGRICSTNFSASQVGQWSGAPQAARSNWHLAQTATLASASTPTNKIIRQGRSD